MCVPYVIDHIYKEETESDMLEFRGTPHFYTSLFLYFHSQLNFNFYLHCTILDWLFSGLDELRYVLWHFFTICEIKRMGIEQPKYCAN